MTKKLSNDERVIEALKEAFPPGVEFELFKESDTVYRVKATAEGDASLTDGLESLKAA